MSFQLIIEGKSFSKRDIQETKLSSINESYIKDIISFLQDWWSDSKTIIAQTSGSTGTPKKIELQKEKMLVSADATGLFFGFHSNSILCSPLSVGFIAGKMMLVRALFWDCTIHCIEPISNPLTYVSQSYDFMVMTPHQLSKGLDGDSKENMKWINKLLLGGSPMSKDLEIQSDSLETAIYIGYGMTETMSHVAIRRINGKDKSQTYKAVNGIQFRHDSRSCLEILTDKLLDENLTTNDVVELISDTEFQWLGRFDHVINSGGIKLFPIQIEEKITPYLHISFYISSKQDKALGEKLVLYLETKNWSSQKEDQLKMQLKKALDPYEIPKEIVVVEKFEYTENGKLIRKTN